MWAQVLSVLGSLLGSAVMGGIIGAQRQAAHKPAGFRTHMLVALGSCAFMEASRLSGDSRIAAGIVTGIGFLGAGSIVRDGLTSRGLTTAASIWAVAAIGLTLGFGTAPAYALAAVETVLTFGALSVTDKWVEGLFQQWLEIGATVVFEPERISPEAVLELLGRATLTLLRTERLSIEHDGAERIATWSLVLSAKNTGQLRAIALECAALPGIRRIDLTESTPS